MGRKSIKLSSEAYQLLKELQNKLNLPTYDDIIKKLVDDQNKPQTEAVNTNCLYDLYDWITTSEGSKKTWECPILQKFPLQLDMDTAKEKILPFCKNCIRYSLTLLYKKTSIQKRKKKEEWKPSWRQRHDPESPYFEG